MTDKQTVFKEQLAYYNLHKEKLLKEGFIITKDTKTKSVFEKNEKNNKELSSRYIPKRKG